MAKYPRESTVLQAAGDHDWKMERAAAAIAEWQAAQSLDPTNPEIARALGSARLRDGKVREAREQFQRAVDARPEVALYHFELANVLFVFRHDLRAPPSLPDEKTILREALGHFQKASDLAPASLEFARAYADTFYGLPEPDWPTAFAAWERVRTVSGTATDLPNSHLARVSLRMGKPEQAETFLALIHDPLFDPVKTKLQKQADEMKRKAEPAAP